MSSIEMIASIKYKQEN